MTTSVTSEPERKLAAILAADVVGFSRMMGEDEVGTVARLDQARRSVIDPAIAAHRGRVFKEMGDGLLAEFGSVVQALRAAIAIQEGLAGQKPAPGPGQRITLRIGLHQGDVLVQGTDLLGDGVNVAARLEALAPAGGICMSARVREDAVGKIAITVEDGGERALKNIVQPMRVFIVRPSQPRPVARSMLAPPARLLVAVTPFASAGGKAAADAAAELSAAMVSSVSGWPGLLAAPAASTGDGTAQTPLEQARQAAEAIGAAFLLQGAVREDGTGLLVALRLLDVAGGHLVWSARHEVEVGSTGTLPDATAEAIGAILRLPDETGSGEPTVPMAGTVQAHRLVLVDSAEPGPPPGKVILLTPARLVIGRQPPSELVLPRGEVSRAHCQVELAEEAVTVTDLGSTNGTFVDNRRIAEPTQLRNGSVLRVGPYVLRYLHEAGEGGADDPEATVLSGAV